MSANQSSITIAGNLIDKPEMKYQNNGRKMCVFRVAVNYSYQNKEGEWVTDDTATYFDVQCWNRLAVNVVDSLEKGTPVIVSGRLYRSTWTVEDKASGETQEYSSLKLRASNVGMDLGTRCGFVRMDSTSWERCTTRLREKLMAQHKPGEVVDRIMTKLGDVPQTDQQIEQLVRDVELEYQQEQASRSSYGQLEESTDVASASPFGEQVAV